MLHRSLHDNLRTVVTLPVAAQVTANEGNGAAADIYDADAKQFLVVIGKWTDGSHAITFEFSEDGGTTWAAIPVADLDGNLGTELETDGSVLIDDDTRADTVLQIGYSGTGNAIRAVNDATTDTTGAVYGVLVQLGGLRQVGQAPNVGEW